MMKKIKYKEIKENQDSYFKAKEISDDLIHTLKGEIEQKSGALNEYLENNSYASEMKTKISDGELLNIEIEKFRESEKGLNRERLLREIREQRRGSKKRGNLIRFSISVAVALAVFSFLVLKDNGDTEIEIDEKIAENITKPTLILSSGEQFTIQSAAGEVITEAYVADKFKEISEGQQQKSNVKKNRLESSFNTLIMPSGYTNKIELSDGSLVTLNAGGRLSYPSSFESEQREVILQGEAFFNIKKSDKPFVVCVNDVKVKVYGTSFNVKEFENGNIETVLLNGSVGVRREGEAEMMIKPNQRMILFSDGANRLEEVDTDCYTGWMQNCFRYQATPLEYILKDIEQWYGVTVDCGQIENEDMKIDLFIDRSSSIDKVFKIIETATDYLLINEGGGRYRVSRN